MKRMNKRRRNSPARRNPVGGGLLLLAAGIGAWLLFGRKKSSTGTPVTEQQLAKAEATREQRLFEDSQASTRFGSTMTTGF